MKILKFENEDQPSSLEVDGFHIKMKRPLMLLMICLAFYSCRKINNDVPGCVDQKIKDFDKTTSCESAEVSEYSFQGNTVYTFDSGTCGADMATEVISKDCKSLGYLGGIAGNTKINGEEFSNARLVRKVWEN